MSDEELMRFSRENRPYRMEREPNGEILIMTPTGYRTGSTNQRISQALGVWADEDGRGVVFDSSTGFTLSNGAIRSPDASWLSHRKGDALTPEQQTGYAPVCPEFVIELTSPSDRLENVKKKVLDEWIANGTELAWLVDSQTRRVTIYRPGQEAEVLEDPTSVQGTGCVAGFELVMERIWGGK
ncbi:Uma2 family endonuclease [Granulicella aggregans]|nr:Uma2 family endonuclease [Granulicella aggregans]